MIVFLGILFDSVNMTIRLDDDKLAAIHAELSAWNERQTASREELQSIIGVLSFAAKVVAPGRTFLRRMIDHSRACLPIPHKPASTHSPIHFEWIWPGGASSSLSGTASQSFPTATGP